MESKSELSCSSPAGVHGPSTDTSGEKKTELSGEIDDLIKAGSESPTSAGTAASQEPDATSVVDDLMRQETPKYLPWGMFSNKDYIKKQVMQEREETARSSATAKLLMVSSLYRRYRALHGNAEGRRSPQYILYEKQERLLGRIHENILSLEKQLKKLEVLLPHVAKDHDEKHQELKEEEEMAGSSARAEHLMGSLDKDYDERHSSILHTYERHHGDAKGWSPWRSSHSILYKKQEWLQGRIHENILSLEKQLKKLEVLLLHVAKDHDEKHQELKEEEETAGSSARAEHLMVSLSKDYSEKHPSILHKYGGHHGDAKGWIPWRSSQSVQYYKKQERLQGRIHENILSLEKQLKKLEVLLPHVAKDHDEKHQELKEEEEMAGSSARAEHLMGSLDKDYDERHSSILHTYERHHGDAKGWSPWRSSHSILYKKQEWLQGRIHENILSLEKQLKKLEVLLLHVAKDHDEKHQELKEEEETAGSSARAEHLMVSLSKDYSEKHPSILHKYGGHHGDAKGWIPWRSSQSVQYYKKQERLQGRIHENILSLEKQLKKLEVLLPHVAKGHDEKHQELKEEEETAGSSSRAEHLMVSLSKDYDGEQQNINLEILERPRNTRSDLERLRTQLKGIASLLRRVAEVYDEKLKLEEREATAGSSARAENLMCSLGKDYDGEQLTVKPGSVEYTRNAARLDLLKTHLKKLELLLQQLKVQVSVERDRNSTRLNLLPKKLKEVELLDEKHPELKEREATAGSSASAEHLMGSLGKHKLKRRHKTAKVLMCPTEESHYVKEQKLDEDRSKEMLSGVQNMKVVRGNRLGSGSCGGETLDHGGSELSVQSESSSDDSCKILEKTAGFPALFSPLVHQGFVQYFPEKDQVQMFTPFITDDFEDETYRFQGSSPGLFQCTVTGLLFHMEGEGEVLYRIVTWNRRLLSQNHKKPAGPLFDIKCLQQSVCQLHLPHCEILSTGGGRFLSVAHIKDEGIELIKPHDITESHVIINITGFSGFGNVKDEDSPPDPVQALVLLFYKPPDDKYPDRSSLSVLLVPRNIVIRDVRRTRRKLNGPERYIDESPHCKLKPKQVYTLSTSPKRRVKVQPTEAEFDEEIHNSFFTSFKVILKSSFKKINLSLTDKSSSSCVWEREVCLSPSTAGTTDLTSCQKLLNIWSSFIQGVSGPGFQTLLDKLLETMVMADSEVEEIKEMPHRRDKARRDLDSVRKKGEAASSKMVEFLCEVDPFFSEHLGLTLREMEQ